MNTTPPTPEQQAADETTPPEMLRILAERNILLRSIVAQNPATPVDLLTKLASTRYKIARKAVAGNPNTPTEVLMKLGEKFPQELLENPVFDLLLLENPNLIGEMPPDTLKSILKLRDLPAYILITAAKHKDQKVLLALANHPETTEATLEKLSQSPHQKVAEAAKLHVNYTTEITEDLILSPSDVLSPFLKKGELKIYFDYEMMLGFVEAIPLFLLSFTNLEVRVNLARNLKTSVNYLEALAKDSHSRVRAEVAKNPNTPPDILKALAKTRSIDVRLGLASNPNTPPNILESLAQSQSKILVCQLASNPGTPVSILEKLGPTKKSLKILRAVFYNPKTPISLKEELSVYLPEDVASNPNTTPDILKNLAGEQNPFVRAEVAKNTATPITVLEILSHDSESWVRDEVAKNANTPAGILETLALKDKSLSMFRAIASHPNTPTHLKEELSIYLAADAEDDDYEDYGVFSSISSYWDDDSISSYWGDDYEDYEVASNPNTPESLLETLAFHRDYQVRREVASNLNTPESLLKTLAQDTDSEVQYRVAKNPKTPVTVLEALVQNSSARVRQGVASNPKTPASLLETLAQDDDTDLRSRVAKNPNTPVTVLETLAKSEKSLSVLRAVAKNPQLPTQLKEELAVYLIRDVETNPQTPESVLETLALDPSFGVNRGVARNPNVPAAIGVLALFPQAKKGKFLSLIKQNPDCLISQILVSVLDNSADPSLYYLYRLIVLLHPQTPAKILAKNSNSGSWMERYAIAQHFNTPEETLTYLLLDVNRLVRAASGANLSKRKEGSQI